MSILILYIKMVRSAIRTLRLKVVVVSRMVMWVFGMIKFWSDILGQGNTQYRAFLARFRFGLKPRLKPCAKTRCKAIVKPYKRFIMP